MYMYEDDQSHACMYMYIPCVHVQLIIAPSYYYTDLATVYQNQGELK